MGTMTVARWSRQPRNQGIRQRHQIMELPQIA